MHLRCPICPGKETFPSVFRLGLPIGAPHGSSRFLANRQCERRIRRTLALDERPSSFGDENVGGHDASDTERARSSVRDFAQEGEVVHEQG